MHQLFSTLNIDKLQPTHIITHILSIKVFVMGQVTIYLEDDIEHKMIKAAESAHLSKSKWIAKVIQEKVANEWPQSVVNLAGTWDDFPNIEDIRGDLGKDTKREEF